MIQPEEIRRKAEKLYPLLLRAWLEGEAFFPRQIPCRKDVDDNLAKARESVQRLRSESKEVRGFGYAVEWAEKNSRKHGRNLFPRRISFETQDDLLKYVGKQREFATFTAAVQRIRSQFPVLDPWIRSHRQLLLDCSKDLEGLLEVVDYLVAHPRPGVFARELPLVVDTKFVERNQRVLREWLDLILPPHQIRADEQHFERRYGLRYPEPLILVRFLDPELQRDAAAPWPQCGVPLHALGTTELSPRHVLIVENKVNLLTLPAIRGALAVGGLGGAVTDLRYVAWLGRSHVWYWGDIDVEGFEILARLRIVFPQAQSLMMDDEHLSTWRSRIATTGSGRASQPPANLSAAETSAFLSCAGENVRIEQERLPQDYVLNYLRSIFNDR